ncbi:hypothetical protein ABVK25_009692 [Lepraria finkii]|uniref:F-box domain-containing protein n=1 Tax=Lepraria finkii TaxID=1340010 RepID=A0ABR4AWN5_9LECA
MGQYWYIFSMDKGEILSCIGKLGEFLWEEEADCLVDILAVPVKPGPVQSSCAPMRLIEISGIKSWPNQKDLEPTRQIQPYLAIIPDELILKIFHDLDFLSCFRLSLISTRLWKIGWLFFQQKATEFMSPWAGAKIICLGDECKSGDWPVGLLTAEEENVVNKGLDEAEVDPDEGFFQDPGNLLTLVMCRFREINSKVEPFQILSDPVPGQAEDLESPRTALDEARHLPKSELSQVRSFAYGEKMANYYPETENWILRNLTTAEFVQGDKLFAAFHRPGRQCGPYLGYPGFGEAVMCRICWSTNHSTVPCAGFNRGVWAGHRFEICTEKIHALKSDSGWRDATSEIVDELSVALNLPTLTKSKKIEDRKQ